MNDRDRDRARRDCERQGLTGAELNACIFDGGFLRIPPTPKPVINDPTTGTVIRPTRPNPNVNPGGRVIKDRAPMEKPVEQINGTADPMIVQPGTTNPAVDTRNPGTSTPDNPTTNPDVKNPGSNPVSEPQTREPAINEPTKPVYGPPPVEEEKPRKPIISLPQSKPTSSPNPSNGGNSGGNGNSKPVTRPSTPAPTPAPKQPTSTPKPSSPTPKTTVTPKVGRP
jgi:hypothetical protein